MSWQTYVDDHLMAPLPSGGTLVHAAIIGHDGGVWAQSPDFPPITTDQFNGIMAGIEDPNALAGGGIKIGGPEDDLVEKYFLIPSEAGSVLRGRFKSDGIVIKKTTSALLVGIYKEPTPAGECSVRVEDLGDYLIGQGI